MRWALLAASFLLAPIVLAVSACDTDDSPGADASADPLAFPFEGAKSGKEDVFGRSLVGAPNPFVPDPTALADPAGVEAAVKTDMRQRRQLAWDTAYRVLEPAPLLGLASQLDARPDCAEGVSDRDLSKCSRNSEQSGCLAAKSGDVAGICTWDLAAERCGPSCDHLSLPDGQAIPTVPRWSTWYGVEDVSRIFKHAYAALTPEQQVGRTPFTDEQIGRAFQANDSQLERSNRWPLHRYTSAVMDLFGCDLTQGADEPDEEFAARCAAARQSKFSGGSAAGGGIARLAYSPAMILHMMRNYGEVLQCAGDKLAGTWCGDGLPCIDPPTNFSACFKAEFPADGGNPWRDLDVPEGDPVAGLPAVGGTVVIKATWARVGFDFELPAFDTDAEALTRIIGDGQRADWGDKGDRQYPAPTDKTAPLVPGGDKIYTISTKSGSRFRLTGMHIMTKELRHWQWITMWWSDKPDIDFGEDRPATFDALPSVWSNYKMCVVADYTEQDGDISGRFSDMPTLQAALEATDSGVGGPTWCSNPYIEHGAGNARTNCIGCHQHAGTRFAEDGSTFDLDKIIGDAGLAVTDTNLFPANGRIQRRNKFASDYSWAFSRLDDLTSLIRKEVEFKGSQDPRWVRVDDIVRASLDPAISEPFRGEQVFRNSSEKESCIDCHGDQGQGGDGAQGSVKGPAYEQLFAQKTDWELLNTIIEGRGDMPAWGEILTDAQMADLFAYLRRTFAPPD